MRRIFLVLAFLISGLAPVFSQVENKWESTIQNFETRDSIAPPQGGQILFVGSSSIAKWTDIQSYFPSYQILNRGFGGSEFSDLLHYSDRVITRYKPSKVFVYEGDNDLAAGKKVSEIMAQAKILREKISKALPGVPVVFISAKPSIARWELREGYQALNAELKRYADAAPLTMYADVWTPMLNKNGKVLPVFVEDNLHMTAEGYKIWQKALAKFLPASKKD